MNTMKYPNVSQSTSMAVNSGTHADDVDPLFISSCWNSNSGMQSEFIDASKLILEGHINSMSSDKLLLDSPLRDDTIETKATMDALDHLLLNPHLNANLAELKPLPPFTGYTANLSINGIQGHHYHTISQRAPEETNNSYNNFNEQNIVSSSTCNISADSAGDQDTKTFLSSDNYTDCVDSDSVTSLKYEDCSQSSVDTTNIKTEVADYDISSIDDIAAIIGSAIADTTVPKNIPDSEGPSGSRDSWMDLDAWIDGACSDQQKNLILTPEFVIPTIQHNNVQPQQSSTLHSLLTQNCMPLLQHRLQNGPPIKEELPSSTNYCNDMISTSSPPSNVVSTTDNLLVSVNGRFLPQYIHNIGEDHLIRSPDMLQNYPHTTTTTPNTPKKSRNRNNQKKQQQQPSSSVFQADQTLGLLSKEKPVHRCSICNRGFLNKSNIKVHLRTHTGEKPFRCDICAKAFRQKAHLIKHQQIHKRIDRD